MNTSKINASLLIIEPSSESLTQLTQLMEPIGLDITIVQSGEHALGMVEKWMPEIILLNSRLPGMDGFETCSRLKRHMTAVPIFFIMAMTEIIDHSKILSVGGVGYITKPFHGKDILVRIHAHIALFRQQKTLIQQNEQLKHQIKCFKSIKKAHSIKKTDGGFIGKSAAISKVLNDIHCLSNTKISVLIEGECGTGKELVARAIHKNSPHAKGPFVAVNCSAIPYELAESEFFGSVRGAFTGALNDRQGYFELAAGGTLFLDEIGEMPLLLQVKLLRALEEKKIRPVGGTRSKPVDVRIIAATNANLLEMIKAGTFRRDLYFRLAGCLITIPPLRARKEDIALLVEHFISQSVCDAEPKELSKQAMQALENYYFPGNVRELKNIIERALIYCDGKTIQPSHLHLIGTELTSESHSPPYQTPIEVDQSLTMDEDKVLAFIHRRGSINNTLCRELLKVNHNRATYLLKKMTDDGRLVRVGINRATSYRLSPAKYEIPQSDPPVAQIIPSPSAFPLVFSAPATVP